MSGPGSYDPFTNDMMDMLLGKDRPPMDPVARARWEMERGEKAIKERREKEAKETRPTNPKPSLRIDRFDGVPFVPVADIVAFLEYYDPTKYANVITGLKRKLPDINEADGR
jgi:hypothetical protein